MPVAILHSQRSQRILGSQVEHTQFYIRFWVIRPRISVNLHSTRSIVPSAGGQAITTETCGYHDGDYEDSCRRVVWSKSTNILKVSSPSYILKRCKQNVSLKRR
jgi:hypothetical protein